jgi:retron-type reverse transcriptase
MKHVLTLYKQKNMNLSSTSDTYKSQAIISPFDEIVSFENLFLSWREFQRGKSQKEDVAEFELRLISHLSSLHRDLISGSYRHGGYTHFKVNDSKPRDIHKASVRDRVVHHAVYRALYPYFDRKFIFDSYSCRNEKGTHRALNRFASFARKEGLNHTRTVWVLKCDARKFFASIDHGVLVAMLQPHIQDMRFMAVIREIIDSFPSDGSMRGIPLGNLTSQLFANVYLDPFDQYVKRTLHARHYIRYADDFVIFSDRKEYLEKIFPSIADFLADTLHLSLHETTPTLHAVASGVDFLGWVHFVDHRVIRRKTLVKMRRTLSTNSSPETIASYLGMLSHGNAAHLREELLNLLDYDIIEA